jgi:hypothetical protein
MLVCVLLFSKAGIGLEKCNAPKKNSWDERRPTEKNGKRQMVEAFSSQLSAVSESTPASYAES